MIAKGTDQLEFLCEGTDQNGKMYLILSNETTSSSAKRFHLAWIGEDFVTVMSSMNHLDAGRCIPISVSEPIGSLLSAFMLIFMLIMKSIGERVQHVTIHISSFWNAVILLWTAYRTYIPPK